MLGTSERLEGAFCEKRNQDTGGAWLSSARAVRCRVKSLNERNPCFLLPLFIENSKKTAGVNRRKERMTSSQHAPYILGYTRNTMAKTIGREPARGSKSSKLRLSSDWSLQLDSMKPESLVIASQLYGGEYVPQFCTHRPSHAGSRLVPKTGC
jgi:hypothetical protein